MAIGDRAIASGAIAGSATAASTVTTVAVGLVTETDSALSITAARRYAVGLATETDTAQSFAWPPKHRLVGLALESDSAQQIVALGGAAPAVQDQPAGGWLRKRRWEPPEPPSAEEVRKQRERLGILPKKTRQAVEKIAERELSQVAADDAEQAYRQIADIQDRAERGLRNELAARRQQWRPELPGIVRALIEDGIARMAEAERRRGEAALAEEQEVRELLSIWMEM